MEGKGQGNECKVVCRPVSQPTFVYTAAIRRSVQPCSHTSPNDRLALSRIKEESALVHIGEVKCHQSTIGGIKGAVVGSTAGGVSYWP